ncbi:TPA: hypothetical protein HA270_04650 [Candidatus Woesearchaeota archaeon]|nr:hypothetical protein [Candidatus Woesearchaeota archaeon]
MTLRGGQAQQIFTYILTIAIVGFLLVMGVRYVMTFASAGDEQALLRFEKQLATAVGDTLYSDDTYMASFAVPSGVAEVCFGNYDLSAAASIAFDNHKIIKNSIDGGEHANVYVLFTDGTMRSFFVDKLKASTLGYAFDDITDPCVTPGSGGLKLKFTGDGDSAFVEKG